MSEAINAEERNQLAAEFALGLLEGEDLERARALAHDDSGFRAEVGRWSGRFAPLLDDVEPVAPPPHLLAAIEQRIGQQHQRADNVHQLRRRLNVWRGLSFLQF